MPIEKTPKSIPNKRARIFCHQIINTGNCEMRYLAVSTKLSPEIAEYPDSGKFGLLAELADEPDGSARRFIFVGREGEGLDYWQGE